MKKLVSLLSARFADLAGNDKFGVLKLNSDLPNRSDMSQPMVTEA